MTKSKLILDDFKWVARDEDDSLWVFKNKPEKIYNVWGAQGKVKRIRTGVENYDFSGVEWEDNKPTLIKDCKIIGTAVIQEKGFLRYGGFTQKIADELAILAETGAYKKDNGFISAIVFNDNKTAWMSPENLDVEDDTEWTPATKKKISEGTIDGESLNIINEKRNQKFAEAIKPLKEVPLKDPIKPSHYRTGDIDQIESWHKRLPYKEFKAVMRSHIEKYLWREKENVIEDLDKAKYMIERLQEYENKD